LQQRALAVDRRAAGDDAAARARDVGEQPRQLFLDLRGEFARASASPANERASAMPSATVLPEPVCERMRRSRTPSSAARMPCWTAVSAVKPRRTSAGRSESGTAANGAAAPTSALKRSPASST